MEEKVKQSQPLRIVSGEWATLTTARCIHSRLWFVGNKPLREYILDYLAKYASEYEVTVYGFVLMGNHYHLLAHFPRGNQSWFHRDLNARIAYGVKRFVPSFPGGPVFERRYSMEVVPNDRDIRNRFLYCALQQVRARVAGGFNSYRFAVTGTTLTRHVVDWGAYKAARRKSRAVSKQRYTKTYTLTFTLPPGGDKEELEARYEAEREASPPPRLKRVPQPGSLPKTTKRSGRYSYRPLVLTECPETKRRYLAWYFDIYFRYKEACRRYLAGEWDVEFPEGTFKPPVTRLTVLAAAGDF